MQVRWTSVFMEADALDKVGHVLRRLFVVHRDDRVNVCCLAHIQKLEDAPAWRSELLVPGAIERLAIVRGACAETDA